MKQVMSSILLLFLLNLVLTATTARSEGNCPVVPGLPGRDGRDGAPGRDGPPGPPGTFSYSELIAITEKLQEQLQTIDVDSLIEELRKRVNNSNCSQDLGRNCSTPAMSCLHIYQCEQSPPSGLYWIVGRDGNKTTSVRVYCDMDSWHCSSKGWTRIAYINMTEDGATCPSGMRQITSPKNLCARTTSGGASCSSVTFSTHGMKYNKVCGQAIGYQRGSPDSFIGPDDINSYYVDGMSITYGSPRKHIWTYAVGLSDDYNYPNLNCPCAKYPGPALPSFVGDHYYCESGNTGTYDHTTVHINDPLWDGEGCGAGNNCCTQPGMPWFCRTLPQVVEGDIEVRLCASQDTNDEDLYLELLEIYLQ